MNEEGRENGQAMVEFALTFSIICILTVMLISVAQGFYIYSQVAAAARYGARWASVVGGQCSAPPTSSTSDWCNQLGGQGSTAFWSQSGNQPKQSTGGAAGPGCDTPATHRCCPSSYTAGSSSYYDSTSGNYSSSTATTVVGAIFNRFDSSSTTRSTLIGQLMPAVDTSKMFVCIDLQWDSTNNTWATRPGDVVGVTVYYSGFSFAGGLLPTNSLPPMVASSQYTIE